MPSTPRRRALHATLLALALARCGGENAASAPDAVADASPDVVPDASPDASLDASPDASLDASPDAVADAVADASPDVAPDLTPDAPADVASELPPDASPDDVEDVAPDASPDVALDASPDVAPPDVALDASPDAAPPDVALDASPDVAPDLPADVAPDAPLDVARDVAMDVGPAPCTGDASCAATPATPVCDRATGRCVACTADAQCGAGRACSAGACVDAPPASCAVILRRDPTRASGTYTVRAPGGAAQSVYCDMSTGRGYTFFLGATANNAPADILAACPAGYAPFQVRSEAHADALRRYVRTRSSNGTWYQANFFAGPAGACPAVSNRAGWLSSATVWSDASVRPAALSPLDFSQNCNQGGVFDPIPVNDTQGFANRGCSNCQVLYSATEMSLASTVVCGVNDLPACAAGAEDCDGNAANGCEVRVSVDDASCGACGRRCASGQACASGRCVAIAGDGISPAPLPPPTSAPAVMATGLQGPQGLAVARSGMVYVTAHRAGVVHRIDPSTTPPTLTSWATGFSDPVGVTVDAAGDVVVVERSANRVTRVTVMADGSAGARAVVASGFSGPWGVVLQRSGEMLVSNQFGASVDRVSAAGVVTRGVISGYEAPLGMRWDNQGRLWVGQYFRTTQSDGVTVHQYDAVLRRLRSITGAAGAAFSGPIGIAFDVDDNAYVSNWDGGARGQGRILRVTPDGATSVWYRGLDGPHAIAFDGRGGLWVADYQSDRVVRFAAP